MLLKYIACLRKITATTSSAKSSKTTEINIQQETLRIATIAMICYTLSFT